MRATITSDSPFDHDRYGYLYSVLAANDPGVHLDYGCFDGRILLQLAERGVISAGIGVDVNSDAIPRVGDGALDVQFAMIGGTDEIADVVDGAPVDSASLLDVLEHIDDQVGLLAALGRIMQPGGFLVVTVPQQHAFSVLDGGNFKFRFPRLHKWLYTCSHSAEEYHYRYVDNPHGLVGDIEKAKSWHQHFTAGELTELLARAGFVVTDVDGAGLFHRPLVYLRRLRLPVSSLIERDMRKYARCHLFITAELR